MSSRRSEVGLADRRWPDLGGEPLLPRPGSPPMDFDEEDGGDYEPPPHPSERGIRRLGRLFPGRRVSIAFVLGIAATLAWQTWGNGPRQALADRFPRLGWIAPRGAAAPGPEGGTEQLVTITRSLAVVRQDIERVSAEVAKLQAAKPEAAVVRTTSPPPPPPPPPASRKPSNSAAR